MQSSNTISMRSIASKVHQGIRISDEDALWLYQSANLAQLGNLANTVNLRKNGKAVYYNVNRHINPTNICALSCKFCAYSKKIGEEGGYAYEIDEMITKAREAIAQGATELHMVGGLHPRWGFQRYVDMIAALRKAYPDIHLKAFTAVELDWMARKARKSITEVIEELRNAGLNSFPGGGAEIFHPEIRDAICDTKVSGEQWIDTHRTAHNLGMRSNCTMLYGHIERYEHRVDHMRRLRDLQDETNGFNVFIPLSFQPFQNEMGVNRYTFGSDDLRNIAVARLYLDNFKHIKSYWVMLGQDVAQLALNFGANDLDGTVLEEKISRAAGGRSGMIMTRSNLESLIRRSGRIPVERTTLYEPVIEADREHMAPVYGVTNPIAQELLNQVKEGSVLSEHEIWQLAADSNLNQLMDSLIEMDSPTAPPQRLSFSETIVVESNDWNGDVESFQSKLNLKIGELAATSLGENHSAISITLNVASTQKDDLRDLVRSIQSAAPQSKVILRNLSGILCSWKSMNSSALPWSEYLFDLRNLGVRGFEFTLRDGLEQSIFETASLLHAMDIRLAVALSVAVQDQAPDWSRFAKDLATIRRLCLRFKDCLIIHVGRANADATLMPSEFMSAVGLTRLILGSQVEIHTPLDQIPTLAPAKGIGADAMQHAATKLISSLTGFGASGLGSVPLGLVHMERVFEDLRASGIIPTLDDGFESPTGLRADKVAALNHIRHVPLVTLARHSKIEPHQGSSSTASASS